MFVVEFKFKISSAEKNTMMKIKPQIFIWVHFKKVFEFL